MYDALGGLFRPIDASNRPADLSGPSEGMLDLLRRGGSPWPGAAAAEGTAAGREAAREKVRGGPAGVKLPWFLPYVDDVTGETAAARAAYRQMWACSNVKAAVLGSILDVAALELKVNPADRKDALHREVADFVRWNLTERLRGGAVEMIWDILSGGLCDGYSVNEKVFGLEDRGRWKGKWPLRHLKPKRVGDDLALETDEHLNVVNVRGLRYNGGLEFAPANFLIYRYLPLYDSPVGTSAFRAAYRHYWMLDTCHKLRSMALEKRALPFLIGWYTPGSGDQASVEEALASARAHNWLSVPEGVRIEALNVAGSADDIFDKFERARKHDIFLAIQFAILQALEGSVTEGRGNSQVHRSTADLGVWYLMASVEALLNDREVGLVKDIVDLNYVVDEYPRVTLSSVNLDEMKRELEIDQGLMSLGVSLSKDEVYEKYGRTPPRDGEDALTDPRFKEQEQPQAGGPQAGGDASGLAALLGGGGDVEAFSERRRPRGVIERLKQAARLGGRRHAG